MSITSKQLSTLLLSLDACLSVYIVQRIRYTEIDWIAYMQQVTQFLAGERDYTLIKGTTGPLVYPAGHVYLYTFLHAITRGGRDIVKGQVFFLVLYLATVAITFSTYRAVKAPLRLFPLLILSRRVHSIFMLRLFNDSFSTFFMALSTHAFVKARYTRATTFFALALSVKMNALLYVPAIAMVLLQGCGVLSTIKYAAWVIQVQGLLAVPFLSHNGWNYLSRAYDFSRVFEYQWTVNWRFLTPEEFHSHRFALGLMAGHAVLLIWFAGTRWNRPSRKSLWSLATASLQTCLGVLFPTGHDRAMATMTPSFVLTTLWSSQLIGIVFARSLHYQFYSWFVFTIPYLLHRTHLPFPLQLVLWVAQEWAWNIYPSTNWSSAVVVAVPIVTLVGVWIGTAKDVVGVVLNEDDNSKTSTLQAKKVIQLAQVRAAQA